MVHFTLLVCTVGLCIGSEVVQGILPVRQPDHTTLKALLTILQNGRDFDPFDILANVVGSVLALLICSWYHKRMLERRRQAKHYDIVPGDELDDRDVELGETSGGQGHAEAQETGVIPASHPNVTEELDNWDENAADWDADEPTTTDGEGQKTPGSSTDDPSEIAKRSD